jgi:CBS domain-containing protein
MTAGQLMNRTFESIDADARLEEAARKLEVRGADLLPVCRDGLLVGTITHEDVASGLSQARRRGETVRVADVIAADILFCFENTDVTEAAKLMRENRVRLLPVLNRGKRVVGILALKDIPEGRMRQESAQGSEGQAGGRSD